MALKVIFLLFGLKAYRHHSVLEQNNKRCTVTYNKNKKNYFPCYGKLRLKTRFRRERIAKISYFTRFFFVFRKIPKTKFQPTTDVALKTSGESGCQNASVRNVRKGVTDI